MRVDPRAEALRVKDCSSVPEALRKVMEDGVNTTLAADRVTVKEVGVGTFNCRYPLTELSRGTLLVLKFQTLLTVLLAVAILTLASEGTLNQDASVPDKE
jgi:hypothetical protein